MLSVVSISMQYAAHEAACGVVSTILIKSVNSESEVV